MLRVAISLVGNTHIQSIAASWRMSIIEKCQVRSALRKLLASVVNKKKKKKQPLIKFAKFDYQLNNLESPPFILITNGTALNGVY